ncbi:sodium- and chloride-dependent glycine transporter 1 [Drosophila tropicalis]|uniref:sodium- and chloride-dependent glycine transporter 1 n=1 Tax=Drosophila tropicalis TaxID=46794 RepID=UPI0035AC166E
MKGLCDDNFNNNNCTLFDGGGADDCENGGGGGGGGGRRHRARQVHSLAVRTTSAYDTLERPFRHDKLRGRWSKSADFYFATSSHAFSSMLFSDLPVWGLMFGGWKYFLLSYLLAIIFSALPIFLIQTFLGQFSSSGTISAFRVSPIFKGIGYSILLLNLATLTYYSIFAAVPFIYAVNSLHPVIPWMSCNNTYNTVNCSTHTTYNQDDVWQDPHSTVEFFRSVVASTSAGSGSLTISWSLLIAVVSLWLFVLALILKPISFIGKTFRCACIVMFSFFLSTFIFMVIHMDVTWTTLLHYFNPTVPDSWSAIYPAMQQGILMAPLMLGPGWGSVLTLASYNSFRTDAEKFSIWVSVTHISIAVMAFVCGQVANDHFEGHVGMLRWHVDEDHEMQFLYLCYAYLFGSYSTLSNLWSFLFFIVIFIAELCALVIQVLNVLTALFDEFEQLRPKKKYVIFSLVFFLMMTSIYFCTQLGFRQMSSLPYVLVLSQLIISVILIIMTTWIYGRVRFQCDLQFMLGKTISSMKIYFIRFATPIFLVICLLQNAFHLATDNGSQLHHSVIGVTQGIIYLVAIFFMVYKMCQTSGSWRHRLRQCFTPHDWHPVDADNRRFYEEIMGTSEMLVIDSNANNT